LRRYTTETARRRRYQLQRTYTSLGHRRTAAATAAATAAGGDSKDSKDGKDGKCSDAQKALLLNKTRLPHPKVQNPDGVSNERGDDDDDSGGDDAAAAAVAGAAAEVEAEAVAEAEAGAYTRSR
jgi:hypothetical protein